MNGSDADVNSVEKAYSENWENTFDKYFLIGWIVAFVLLLLATWRLQPELFTAYGFFAFCLTKIAVMVAMSLVGGLMCRHYCRTDENGYIVSSKSGGWFKVNYTRKLQHFAAYLVPLINPATKPFGILPHLWEALLVFLIFLLMIKPIRERSTFFMLQFNSMDRPEDRPNTLKWIVVGNLLPGIILSTIFQQIFEDQLGEPYLALIIVFIVGIGDGLAEPVGIYMGWKKYYVPSWNMKRRYVRSVGGSACVFLCSIISVIALYGEFNALHQFVAALVLLPPVMTLTEAVAPHSMDTPLMMVIGYGLLYGICLF